MKSADNCRRTELGAAEAVSSDTHEGMVVVRIGEAAERLAGLIAARIRLVPLMPQAARGQLSSLCRIPRTRSPRARKRACTRDLPNLLQAIRPLPLP